MEYSKTKLISCDYNLLATDRPVCLEDVPDACKDHKNGNYASCKGCELFVSCSNGIYTLMECPHKLQWDDDKRQCEYESTTCGKYFWDVDLNSIYNPAYLIYTSKCINLQVCIV